MASKDLCTGTFKQISCRIEKVFQSKLPVFVYSNGSVVGGVAQWWNVGLWPANFPCPALDLQLMGDH